MGNVPNVDAVRFPRQGPLLGKRVRVFFSYDLANPHGATVVRSDAEAPHRDIFRLDDGRYVLSTECQYSTVGATNG